MKIISIILVLLSIVTSVEAQTYSLFDDKYKKVILSFDIVDKNEVIILDENEKKVHVPLAHISGNYYAVGSKKYMIISFLHNDGIMAMFKTTFTNIDQVREFVENPINIKTQITYYFVRDITLQQLSKFPSKKKMRREHKEIIEKIKDDFTTESAKIIVSSYQKEKSLNSEIAAYGVINIQSEIAALTCLLGYKPR
ncbi:hypothetical protein [Dysgonomonas sp. 511]|uniref:hypothetical protein n=1 Tax=Dysgonomonas sp. 511 TaxID=2302930 RepID=UPI0013D7E01D|nr:hypothetical protein [Dysgonomonas sp. 511]NDV78447.1 hypothetical protein [Dysgonomonas sp. 511]